MSENNEIGTSAPRTRGDGPDELKAHDHDLDLPPPHPRG
ncbi:hypothetical protein RKD44_007781 [Streptomyces collinus]